MPYYFENLSIFHERKRKKEEGRKENTSALLFSIILSKIKGEKAEAPLDYVVMSDDTLMSGP